MKNFRKVLALILVVATLCSFVAMASAKTTADYADASEVKYVEAVDVLSTIGILKGYDGKYHPTKEIDRDEMAKMVTVLANGGEDNADLFVGANTFADVKGTWAEGYVAYAAQVGIINGRNATTFDPNAKVTGVEVLKMLLCTLGYDAKEQGYVGANWQVNVMRDAKKMGLLVDGVNAYAPATRDVAAQMMFNALNANLVVGYVSENLIDVSNSLYIAINEDEDFTGISLKDADQNGWEVAYCNAVISNVALRSIFTDLTWEEGTDCYGRPGHYWFYGEDEIGFYTDAYKAKQTEGDVDSKLVTEKVYVNGFEGNARGGNGVVVEYYDDVTVVIDTFIAKVGTVNEYYNYFTLVNEAGKQLGGRYPLGDYELAEGDVVLYWTCADGLHDVKVISGKSVEIAEGVNYKDWDASYIVAGGETYKYASVMGLRLNVEGRMDRLTFTDVADDNKYDLYFDEYGFIKYYEVTAPAADETFYTYLVEGTLKSHEHGTSYDEYLNPTPIVDYTMSMVNYGTDGTLSVSADVAVKNANNAELLDASKFGMGSLALVNATDGNEVVATGTFAKVGTELNKDSFKLGNGLYATSKTLFMIRTKNLDGSYTYEQVTGYKNLKGNYVASEVMYNGKATQFTNIQYFVDADHADDTFVTHVFIDAKYTKDFDTSFLTLGEADYYAFKTDLKALFADDYTAYTVMVGGEEAIVLIDKDEAPLAKVTKYEATLAYINVAVTVDGKDMPIYSVVNETGVKVADPAIECYYNVVEGETYIRFKGDDNVYMLAEDALVLTLTANKNDDGEWVTDVYEGILALEDEDGNEEKAFYAYVTIEDDYVTELIRVDAEFIDHI